MFFGKYESNLDEKGRVVIPSKYREELGDKLYLIKGFEGCVSLYKEEDFINFIDNLKRLQYEKSKVRQYQRLLLESVVELTIDKHGRVLIPTRTLKEYEISSKVTIVGVINHLELWDSIKYDNYKKDNEGNFELDAESLIESNEER
ncbi:MAG: division/cell wall cluster transcriptional repressor MraZ [Bacilli bacterium]|nr:division/cell wall cluster transcriptional repressor MraZ [Bacilli bacterium]